jgi:hypothetical protein
MKNNLLIILLLIVAGVAGAYFVSRQPLALQHPGLGVAAARAVTTTGVTPVLGTRLKQGNCRGGGPLADSACTPGAIFPAASKATICVQGYAGSVRNVPAAEKRAVYDEYGIVSHATGQYEVDHLVSLELGGSNDIANLWPEPAQPVPGFHQKDSVENYLHGQVCTGAIPLDVAQRSIASNWLAIYQSMSP